MEGWRRCFGNNFKISPLGSGQSSEGWFTGARRRTKQFFIKRWKKTFSCILAFGVSLLLGIFVTRGLVANAISYNEVETDRFGDEGGVVLFNNGKFGRRITTMVGGVNAPEGFYLTSKDFLSIEKSLRHVSKEVYDLIRAQKRKFLKPNLIPDLGGLRNLNRGENKEGNNDIRGGSKTQEVKETTSIARMSEVEFLKGLEELGVLPKPKPIPSGRLNRPRLVLGSQPTKHNARSPLKSDGVALTACVNISMPLEENEKDEKSEEWERLLGTDFRSVLLDHKVPHWCSELLGSRQEPCVWGSGLSRGRVMEKSTFFIRVSGPSVRCYTRTTGSGVILPQITVAGKSILRVEYIPQQEGDYGLWVMCDSVLLAKFSNNRPFPNESVVPPWLHQYTTLHSPYHLVVEPNSNVSPRGCEPCEGPVLGELSGQWVQRSLLICECGREALGFMEEWFVDDYVWSPRTCVIPFRSRVEFLERFRGRALALAGDESVRGHFIDLANWLNGVGPEILQDPSGYKMSEEFSTSWDEWVSGFNGKPFEADVDLVLPNPLEVGDVRISYFQVGKLEKWVSKMASIMQGELPSLPKHLQSNKTFEKIKPYDAIIFSLGTWFGNFVSRAPTYDEDPDIAKLVYGIIEFLKCPKGKYSSCMGPYKGRLIYRSNTGRFDSENYCARPKIGSDLALGKACAINSGVIKMIQETYKTGSLDGDLLYLDALNITYSRPDRSIDGVVFYPHKCITNALKCTVETKEIQDCCWDPNLFPHVGSLTLTHMLVNMLWDDPLLVSI